MHYQKETWRGQHTLTLTEDAMTLRLLPERGGKAASLQWRGVELLAQPRGEAYPPLRPDMPFHEGDASGFDDVFPSMGVEELLWQGKRVTLPDHGRLWSRPMTAEAANDRVTLRYTDAMLSFAYEKQVSLTGEAVRFQYAITNRGEAPMPCVWVCHCLLRLEPDCRFIFPQEGGVAENLIPGTALGGAGECHPLVGDGYDFSRPPVPQSALKFYLQAPVQDAHCAVLYPSQGIQTHLRWDGETLPYLGFWITTGAYRGDCNFAFEPATAYYDTVACAAKHDRLPMLAPGETKRFWMELQPKKA